MPLTRVDVTLFRVSLTLTRVDANLYAFDFILTAVNPQSSWIGVVSARVNLPLTAFEIALDVVLGLSSRVDASLCALDEP